MNEYALIISCIASGISVAALMASLFAYKQSWLLAKYITEHEASKHSFGLRVVDDEGNVIDEQPPIEYAKKPDGPVGLEDLIKLRAESHFHGLRKKVQLGRKYTSTDGGTILEQ